MLDLKRILVPTDLSDSATDALTYATRFAASTDADLHLVHVTTPDTDPDEPTLEAWPPTAEAREELDAKGCAVETHETRGRAAAETILEYARDLDVDLIVMGSHGRRGVRRMVIGSVAEEVLRHARCPVVLVRNGRDRATMRRILVPVDFSERTPSVLAHAAAIARASRATIELVHVIEEPRYPDFYMATLTLPETERRAHERLTEMARALGPDIEASVEVLHGRAPDLIATYAGIWGYDLIVMSSHGYSGLKRALLGSTSESVVRRAPCPVLILKAGERDLITASRENVAEKASV